jgi:hypothetical protein
VPPAIIPTALQKEQLKSIKEVKWLKKDFDSSLASKWFSLKSVKIIP